VERKSALCVKKILKILELIMKDKLYFWASVIIGVVAIVLFIMLYTSCMTAPSRSDHNVYECYVCADYAYRNQKNPDKATVQPLIKDCIDTNKEHRNKNRIEYCKKNKSSFNNSEDLCRSYLNQK
jgi:hypothetical protein